MGPTRFRLAAVPAFRQPAPAPDRGRSSRSRSARTTSSSGCNRKNAVERIHENLDKGALLFTRRVDARLDELSGRAALMSDDYSIRQLFLKDSSPIPQRFGRPWSPTASGWASPSWRCFLPTASRMGDTGGALPRAALRPFQDLVKVAAAADDPRATGFARLPPDGPGGKLYALLVVPIYAPKPEIVAWIGLALPIDHDVRDRAQGGRAP